MYQTLHFDMTRQPNRGELTHRHHDWQFFYQSILQQVFSLCGTPLISDRKRPQW
jgi:hypothetical protein